MAVEPELLELMPNTITLTAPGTRNAANEETYGTGTAYQCRIVPRREEVKTGVGITAYTAGQAVLATVVAATTRWKAVLEDGTRVYIIAVDQNYDENGPYNTTITYGEAP